MLLFFTDNIPDVFALWRPAIDSVKAKAEIVASIYESDIKADTILIRTLIVATAAMALIAIAFPTHLAILSMIPIYFLAQCYQKFELNRAATALNKIAVDQFMKPGHTLKGIKYYVLESPSAVLQLVLRPDFDPSNPKFINLMSNLMIEAQRTTSCFDKKPDAAKLSIGFLIAKGFSLKTDEKDYVLEMLNNQAFDSLVYSIFSLDKVKPNDRTELELAKYWEKIHDPKLMQLLVKKGFNIDARDENEETALQKAIKQQNARRIAWLLLNGAKIPETINIKNDNFIEQTFSLDDFIADKPVIKAIIDKSSQSPFLLHDQETHSFAFWKPAVKVNNDCNQFHEAIFTRVLLVSSIAYLALFLSPSLFVAAIATPITFGACWLYYKVEWSRAIKELNDIAVKLFKNVTLGDNIVKHMVRHESVIDQLIADPTNNDYFTIHGTSLWKAICKYESFSSDRIPKEIKTSVFKKLANHLFNKLTQQQKYTYFVEAIKSGEEEFVTHLTSIDNQLANSFSEKQQQECWKEREMKRC